MAIFHTCAGVYAKPPYIEILAFLNRTPLNRTSDCETGYVCGEGAEGQMMCMEHVAGDGAFGRLNLYLIMSDHVLTLIILRRGGAYLAMPHNN